MSAFLVDNETLGTLADGLVSLAKTGKICGHEIEAVDTVTATIGTTFGDKVKGDVETVRNYISDFFFKNFYDLNLLNAQSLRYRYGDTIEENIYDNIREYDKEYTIEEYAKYLNCFLYQCDSADFDPLYKALTIVADYIMENIVDINSEEYRNAKWG